MSFWKSLFGRGASDARGPVAAAPAATLEHKGYLISAMPYAEGGQYQVAGTITRTVDGVVREHRFVRADRFASQQDATEIALMKGRQLVDQQGDRMFS